jgi:hypothetical protein
MSSSLLHTLQWLMHWSRRSSVMQLTVYEGCSEVTFLGIILNEGTGAANSLDVC